MIMYSNSWKKRYFVFSKGEETLSYYDQELFDYPSRKQPKGVIQLRDKYLAARNHPDCDAAPLQLLLLSKETSSKELYLLFDDQQTVDAWRAAIEHACGRTAVGSTTTSTTTSTSTTTTSSEIDSPSVDRSIRGTDTGYCTLAKELGYTTLKVISSLGQKVPIFGKFFGIMDELLVVYENFEANKDAAMKLRDRILDICRTLIPALEKHWDYFDDVLSRKFVELTTKLEEMKLAFEEMTAMSLTNVLRARDQSPAQRCNDIDRDVTYIINSIFQLLGLQQALEVHSIYDQMMKLASEADKGPYQFIHVVALRTFWKDIFRNDRSVKISDFVSFLMLTFQDQNRLDGINKDVLNETFVALDKDKDGSISIMEMMQSTRFINRDASLYETMKLLIRNKNILLIIPSTPPNKKP